MFWVELFKHSSFNNLSSLFFFCKVQDIEKQYDKLNKLLKKLQVWLFFYICWSPFTILSLYVPCAHVSLGHKMVLLRSYKLKFSYLTIGIVRYIVAFEIVLGGLDVMDFRKPNLHPILQWQRFASHPLLADVDWMGADLADPYSPLVLITIIENSSFNIHNRIQTRYALIIENKISNSLWNATVRMLMRNQRQ